MLRLTDNRQSRRKKGGIYEEIVTRFGIVVRHLWRCNRRSEYKHCDEGGANLAERDRRETSPGHH